MTIEQKQNRAYLFTLIGAASFGYWQHSFFAGLFLLCPLLFLGGLVVVVQDGFIELIKSQKK